MECHTADRNKIFNQIVFNNVNSNFDDFHLTKNAEIDPKINLPKSFNKKISTFWENPVFKILIIK